MLQPGPLADRVLTLASRVEHFLPPALTARCVKEAKVGLKLRLLVFGLLTRDGAGLISGTAHGSRTVTQTRGREST